MQEPIYNHVDTHHSSVDVNTTYTNAYYFKIKLDCINANVCVHGSVLILCTVMQEPIYNHVDTYQSSVDVNTTYTNAYYFKIKLDCINADVHDIQ